jgi:predicted transcriptional regulator
LDSFSKLYSNNLDLISALANDHPESIVALAKLIKREESNVSRTLNKLEKFGLVELVPSKTGRTKRPVLVMKMVRFDLDLLSGRMSLAGMRHSAAA